MYPYITMIIFNQNCIDIILHIHIGIYSFLNLKDIILIKEIMYLF